MNTSFLLHIQSVSNVITNSSSELFVIGSDDYERENIEEILNIIYPYWSEEYRLIDVIESLKLSKENEDDDYQYIIDYLLYYLKPDYFAGTDYYDISEELSALTMNGCSKETAKEQIIKDWKDNKNSTPSGFMAARCGLNPEEFWKDWDTFEPFEERGENFYANNYPHLELSEEGFNALKEYYHNGWLLISKHDNPDWEGQQKLELFAKRIHLG